jgi:hypothetical protein
MKDVYREELFDLATNRTEPLAVWQARIHDNEYRLTFERLV